MANSNFSEGFGLLFFIVLLFYSAWKSGRLNIKLEKPHDSTSSTIICTILVLACGYFAREIFIADPTNIYKIIGEPFSTHPLLLRTQLHKYEEQLQETIALSADQTFERIMGKDGMQLSYATVGSLVFTYPYAESLSQFRIPMVSVLSRSYGIMLILIACGHTMPNRGLWKKWGVIALVVIGVAQLFCLNNLQFLDLDGNDTLMEITNRYKSIAFIAILTGIMFVGETQIPTQNEVLLQTVHNLHVSKDWAVWLMQMLNCLWRVDAEIQAG